ncbi:MAG: HAD hydrolase family protein [Chloroflexi bacterium]|nr:HAD hydrolase family protein [Chloroflexota bacterium]
MLAHCDSTPVGAVETVLAYAGARLWATYEIVDTLGRTHVFYAGRTRADLSHLIWGPNGERVDGPDVEHQPSGLVVGLEPRWNRRRARSAAALSDATILGCWCVGTPEALAPLDAQARNGDFFGARYLPWGARLSQILKRPRLRLVGRDVGAKTATKGVAAARLCAQLGIAPEETAAFGDGDNDLELLEFAGTAVAMANGTPRSRARAGLIAPPHSADGVAQVLRRWLGDLRA